MATRVQIIDGKATLEVTETVIRKRHYKEADLLRELEYFTGLKTKAEEGLTRVNGLLTQLQSGKAA